MISINAGILLIGLLGTNFSEILIEIQTFSFKKKHLKVSSVKWRPFCLGLSELISSQLLTPDGKVCRQICLRLVFGIETINPLWPSDIIKCQINAIIVIQGNASEKAICKMSAILFRPQSWTLKLIFSQLLVCYWLTHLPLDKMAAILADNIFKCIFLNENDRILIQISLKFVPRSPIDNKPALVQALPEPMMAQFTDTYMQH